MLGEALKTYEKESYMTQKVYEWDVGIPVTPSPPSSKKVLNSLYPPWGRHTLHGDVINV